MKDRNEYDKLLHSLKEGAQQIEQDGVPIELRNCADRQPGQADPRSALASHLTREEFAAHRLELDGELWANADHLFGPTDPENYSPLELLRFEFGWTSSDLSCGIRTLHREIPSPDGPVSVYQYERLSTRQDRPCVVLIHGGGFFGGVIPTVENQCKLLAQLMDGVVLAVEYPLCPEHKYPAGFNACWATVVWAQENAAALGIDPAKIGVAGDSAGGNLSLACGLKDRDEGSGRIAFLGLIYPTLSRREKVGCARWWKPELYDNPTADPLIEEKIREIGQMGDQTSDWYLPEGQDPDDPYVSPIEADPAGLPKVLLMTAEYDFLRAECDAYAGMLKKAGVPCRCIRYGGIFHGTFDRLGYAPQVEDMLREIASEMRAL